MARKSPKVSVLISTYNRPDYLRDAINSVVNQSMKDWELLVMNDGGVSVGEVVNQFEDSRIQYFDDKVNKGVAVRFNFGLKQACGDYIAYLGDDDIYYPNHLEVLSRALDENPDIGAVYSDLNSVFFIKDKKSGKRYALHKYINISRDYNRDVMFYHNFVLHVALMHRRDLALQAEGYDETVTVLVDWNLTRKLSFYTDFKYIQVLTGEYYHPITESDRISKLEREDKEKFKHNLRKIKADLPPEPWPKADRIAVIFPVNEWTDSVVEIITGLIDNLSYPVRFIIVNNDMEKEEAGCREALGKIGELKNISIFTPTESLTELGAYRFGAQKAEADYVYLPSEKVDTKLQLRLILARQYFKKKKAMVYKGHFGRGQVPRRYVKKKKFEGIKWNVEQEKESSFDLLIRKKRFLQLTDPAKGKMETDMAIIPLMASTSFKCDYWFLKAKEQSENGNDELALELLQKAGSIKKGGVTEQYLIDVYFKLYFALGKYDEAEEKCRALIRRGYGADNWIRLGMILQKKKKFAEAIEAYSKGLGDIGLKETDLESCVFPLVVPWDFDSFTAFIGLGECFLKTGRLAESAKMFRKATKLKANSNRPLLGFVELFLESNDLDRAEEALTTARKVHGKDPETQRLLGILYEKKGQHGQFGC